MERGIITQISGPVVDVEIVQGELPRLRDELLEVRRRMDEALAVLEKLQREPPAE